MYKTAVRATVMVALKNWIALSKEKSITKKEKTKPFDFGSGRGRRT